MTDSSSIIQLLEACGPGPLSEVVVTAPTLLANDSHSLSPGAQQLRPSRSGAPVLSCERWLRVRFTPPVGLVGNLRLWVPGIALPTGWHLRFGTSADYSPPSSSRSVYALADMPATDPGVSNLGGDVTIDDTGMHYTPWIVVQASLTGTDVDVSEQTLSVHFGWTES